MASSLRALAGRRWAAPAAALALAFALLVGAGVPFLAKEREVIASTPTPHPIRVISPLVLEPGAQACMDNVTLGPDSQVARFSTVVATEPRPLDLPAGMEEPVDPRPGPPLELVARGDGYSSRAGVPGGYRVGGRLEARLDAPARRFVGEVCIRNLGRRPVSLVGTEEGRTVSRSFTSVDGERHAVHVSLTLLRAEREALFPRVPEMLTRMAALSPLTPGLAWLLVALVLLAVPLAVFVALRAGLAAGDAAVPDARATAPPVPLGGRLAALRPRLAAGVARAGRLPGWVWIALLVAVCAAWFSLWATRTHSFQPDEEQYVYLARWMNTGLPSSLWDFEFIRTGLQRLEIVLLVPIVGLLPGPTWATVGHVVNATLFASTAIPVFLVVRGLGVAVRWALLAAAVTVVVPWAVVATSFLTEPVAYPAFAFAVWAIWASVTRGGWRWDLLAIVLTVVAGIARVNLLAIGAILPLAIVLHELRYGDARAAAGAARAAALARAVWRRHALLVVAAALGALALVASSVGGLAAADKLTGFYGIENRLRVPLVLLTDKLDVYTTRFVAGIAFVPFAIGLAWLVQALVRPRDPARFAFALVGLGALAILIWTSAGAGADERYLIYYAPVFAVAFAVALAGREARPWLVACAGVLGAVLLWRHGWEPAPQAGYSWFVSPAEANYANIVLPRIERNLPGFVSAVHGALALALVLAAVAAAMLVKRPWAPRLRNWVIAGLLLVQLAQTGSALSKHVNAAGARFGPPGEQRAWVDERLYGNDRAAVFAAGQANSVAFDSIWSEIQFWNDSVDAVVTVGDRQIRIPPSDGHVQVEVDPRTGRFSAPLPARNLLVPRAWIGMRLDAVAVAQSPYMAIDLVRVREPRVLWRAEGPQPDGYLDDGQTVTIRLYRAAVEASADCAAVHVFAPAGPAGRKRVTLSAGGSRRTAVVPAAETARVALPLADRRAPYTDLRLTARGAGRLPDGREASVQLSAVGAEPCTPG